MGPFTGRNPHRTYVSTGRKSAYPAFGWPPSKRDSPWKSDVGRRTRLGRRWQRSFHRAFDSSWECTVLFGSPWKRAHHLGANGRYGRPRSAGSLGNSLARWTPRGDQRRQPEHQHVDAGELLKCGYRHSRVHRASCLANPACQLLICQKLAAKLSDTAK